MAVITDSTAIPAVSDEEIFKALEDSWEPLQSFEQARTANDFLELHLTPDVWERFLVNRCLICGAKSAFFANEKACRDCGVDD
jgi:hypothetical protein